MSRYRKNKLNKKVLAWLLMVNLGVQPILTAIVLPSLSPCLTKIRG